MPIPPTAHVDTGFSWTAIIGSISLVMNAGFGAVGIAWIKNRAPMRKLDLDGDEKLRSEMWKDIADLKAAKQTTSTRLSMAEARLAAQTVQIGQLRFVSTLVVDELERVSPGNAIARQVRVLLHDIQPDAMPFPEEVAPMTEMIARMELP